MRPGIRPDHQWPKEEGRIDLQTVRLGVLTGLEDDARAELAPRHELHPLATEAFARQDDWILREHAAFWTAAMRLWPATRGQRATRESLDLTTYLMRRAGLSASEIADHLCLQADTVRRHIKGGAEVWNRSAEYCDLGTCLLRRVGTLDDDDAPPLPRVYRPELEPPPTWTYFNPLIGDAPARGRSPEAERYKERGADLLRDRWRRSNSAA